MAPIPHFYLVSNYSRYNLHLSVKDIIESLFFKDADKEFCEK